MIRSWIRNYIHVKQWDVITRPYPNSGGFEVGMDKSMV